MKMKKDIEDIDAVYKTIKGILHEARSHVFRTINFTMVQAYWNIGRVIVEEEQDGMGRATYGSGLLESLSKRLTADFGKGFDASNLRNIRKFYLTFPNCDALRHELSWTHYRLILKLDKEDARSFYINEIIENNWSTRQLERQINSHYYERLIGSTDKSSVVEEMKVRTKSIGDQNIIKDPYICNPFMRKRY